MFIFYSFTTSPGSDSIFVDFADEEGSYAGVQHEAFDRRDGSLVVRYRPFHSYKKLQISVKNAEGDLLGLSPYVLDQVNSENCFCPAPLDVFKKSFRCPVDSYEQIKLDLSRFGPVNLTETIPKTISRFSGGRGSCFVHYTIINNRVSVTCTSILNRYVQYGPMASV